MKCLFTPYLRQNTIDCIPSWPVFHLIIRFVSTSRRLDELMATFHTIKFGNMDLHLTWTIRSLKILDIYFADKYQLA